jgi:hypothetical protein
MPGRKHAVDDQAAGPNFGSDKMVLESNGVAAALIHVPRRAKPRFFTGL